MYYQYIFFIKYIHLVFNFLLLNICPCPRNKELFSYFKYKAFKVVLLGTSAVGCRWGNSEKNSKPYNVFKNSSAYIEL